jgi:hypothetical protein
MQRELKVYGWIDYKSGKQYRCIVAAHSFAAASRASVEAGLRKIRKDYYSTTGNEQELETALPHEGVVFIRPLDDWHGEFKEATK